MEKKQKPPREAKVIALANQKGGTAKTTSTVNLGIGLANQGKRVLLVDADPQGDLTTALGSKHGNILTHFCPGGLHYIMNIFFSQPTVMSPQIP